MPTASCSSICWPSSAPASSSHERLLRFLRDGEIASLEIGLALHARLELNHVRRLLYHADRRHLAALCIAAGLATPHYLTLRMALEIAEEAMARRPANAATAPTPSASCRCSTSKLRRDEAKLRLLLGN